MELTELESRITHKRIGRPEVPAATDFKGSRYGYLVAGITMNAPASFILARRSRSRHKPQHHSADMQPVPRRSYLSAVTPKADMCGALAHVCFVPIADIPPLTRSPGRRARAVMAACRAIELIGARLWALANRHRIARIEVVNPLLPHSHKCTRG